MPTDSESKISVTRERIANFFKIFLTNKRGLLGFTILIVFSAVAIAAPLLSSNHPVLDTYVAGDFAAPLWYARLHGEKSFCPNLEFVSDSGFPTMSSLADEWNFTETDNTNIFYNPNVGSPRSGPGCVEILFRRSAAEPLLGKVEAHLTSKPFDFPYNSPPVLFKCNMSIQATGVENVRSVHIILSIKWVENGTSYVLWDKRILSSENWTMPLISSYSRDMKERYDPVELLKDPARVVFSQSGQLMLDVHVSFDDRNPDMDKKKVEVAVYIDDVGLRLYGNTYGILGTDQWGRDVWSQIVHGARISLFVGLLAAFVGVVIGLLVGLAAGYLRPLIDESLMRFTDVLLVLPGLPLLLVLIAVLGPSVINLIILIGLLGWMGFARVVRSQVLSLKERPFVEASKAVGAGKFHIITKHILPNVMSLVYVSLALSVPSAILAEAALSFLGLFDPTIVSWGRMLHDAQAVEGGLQMWWWWLPPGLLIAVISVSFILLGYALDEVLNPKLRKRR